MIFFLIIVENNFDRRLKPRLRVECAWLVLHVDLCSVASI